MYRDPLHKKIREGLRNLSDGNLFEACAVDLLSVAYPNLAPMRGGSDDGMDGSFGTPSGEFPLVATISKDVIGNFRRNLREFLKKRNGPKIAVIATSQCLSTAQKKNLHKAAEKIGVTIVNIHDGDYFANKLYRDAKWRQNLLKVSGSPSAFSVFPRSGRYSTPDLFVGREPDLEWLRTTKGDLLLVGSPGSGKTYLHQKLVAEGRCLFAIDRCRERLADAIRDSSPGTVIVDDAQVNLEMLEELVHLRAELGADYYIHANCWPSFRDRVASILPNCSIHKLDLIPQSEIAELVRISGISGPDWLIYTLITQSDGKPGLAAALIESCKLQDLRKIWRGEVLLEKIAGRLNLTTIDKSVLAAFSIGGDSGVSLQQVSSALNVTHIELQRMTSNLSSGGLIEECRNENLQVRPPAIRPILLRDVFFAGANSLDIRPHLREISERQIPAIADLLISAKQRGARVDQMLLTDLAERANNSETWEKFAWLNQQSAKFVLDKYPSDVCGAAPGLLHFCPARTLNALLDADESNPKPQSGAITHPRRQISDWAFDYKQTTDETIKRRRLLLDVLEERSTGNGETFVWALTEVLRCGFDDIRVEPGNNRMYRNVFGIGPLELLRAIDELWPRILKNFHRVPTSAARTFFNGIESWVYPRRYSRSSRIPVETLDFLRDTAHKMLNDFVKSPQCTRAWRTCTSVLFSRASISNTVCVDPDFDLIFSTRHYSEDWQVVENTVATRLKALADKLIHTGQDAALSTLINIRLEAAEFRIGHGTGRLLQLYREIAKSCFAPENWIRRMIALSDQPEHLEPFISRLVTDDKHAAKMLLLELMNSARYKKFAANQIIRMQGIEIELIYLATSILDDPSEVQVLQYLTEVSVEVIAELLQHERERIRGEAAMVEWKRNGGVRKELKPIWRNATKYIPADTFELDELLKTDKALAYLWLTHQLRSQSSIFPEDSPAFHAACKLLTYEERLALLPEFSEQYYCDELFNMIIGQHTILFANWLRIHVGRSYRLRPLHREIDARWEEFAAIALDCGLTSDELSHNCFPKFWSESIEDFDRRIERFQDLVNHENTGFHKAGIRGLEWAKLERERQGVRLRAEDIYGCHQSEN